MRSKSKRSRTNFHKLRKKNHKKLLGSGAHVHKRAKIWRDNCARAKQRDSCFWGQKWQRRWVRHPWNHQHSGQRFCSPKIFLCRQRTTLEHILCQTIFCSWCWPTTPLRLVYTQGGLTPPQLKNLNEVHLHVLNWHLTHLVCFGKKETFCRSGGTHTQPATWYSMWVLGECYNANIFLFVKNCLLPGQPIDRLLSLPIHGGGGGPTCDGAMIRIDKPQGFRGGE